MGWARWKLIDVNCQLTVCNWRRGVVSKQGQNICAKVSIPVCSRAAVAPPGPCCSGALWCGGEVVRAWTVSVVAPSEERWPGVVSPFW